VSEVYNNDLGFELPDEHLPTSDQLKRLERGDPTVVNELIEGLTAYVVDKTNWFIREQPHAFPFQEDLVSESLFTLTESVPKLLGRSFTLPSLLGYLRKRIEGSCTEWLSGVGTINIPRKTQTRTKQVLKKRDLREWHVVASEEDMYGEFEFDDFVEGTFDEVEQEIVRMLIQGQSILKIAEEIGLSESKTKNLIEEIRDQFRKEEE